jgi:DMSO/TMAO reductase YedYZ molybdopterin-dependent catalytic subunit
VAAVLLTGIWSVGRAARELASHGAGGFLFFPPEVVPRVPGFPVAGQTPEVTSRAQFYVVSKNPEDPAIDGGLWRLRVDGEVASALDLDLASLLEFPRIDGYVTLQCVSNPVGGTLMSNGLWSGVSLRDLLVAVRPLAGARWVAVHGRDGHYETLPLELLLADGAMLAYALNGDLLDRRHGYPARLLVPGRYGFKNVKWVERIQLVQDHQPGYWSGRGWTALGEMRTTTRVDVVQPAGDNLQVAGIALAGDRGISQVEVRYRAPAGAGPWVPAELHHPPLGSATWVQWRALLPRPAGSDWSVEARAWDGRGAPQEETERPAFPDGSSGLHRVAVAT